MNMANVQWPICTCRLSVEQQAVGVLPDLREGGSGRGAAAAGAAERGGSVLGS